MSSFQYRVNRYTCEDCRAHIITIDKDAGVTPFLTSCKMEDCTGFMRSAVYRVYNETPEYEWYRPSLEEYQELDIYQQDYIRMGGLLLRKIPDLEEVMALVEKTYK